MGGKDSHSGRRSNGNKEKYFGQVLDALKYRYENHTKNSCANFISMMKAYTTALGISES